MIIFVRKGDLKRVPGGRYDTFTSLCIYKRILTAYTYIKR